jgi:hypothetical protein
MWINSPLSKWDQDALVNKALRDAERRRTLAAAGDADGGTMGAGLRWPADLTRRTVDVLQMWLATQWRLGWPGRRVH